MRRGGSPPPPTGRSADGQSPPPRLGPFPHGGQTEGPPPAARGRRRTEAGAVAPHRHQGLLSLPPETDPGGARPGVLPHVVERLLDDADELDLHLGREPDAGVAMRGLPMGLPARLLAALAG